MMATMRGRAAALAATLGTAAVLALAAAVPALATGTMCTSNGNHLCTGLSAFIDGTPVKTVSNPGRTLDWQPDGGHGPQGFPTGVLRFTGDSSSCIVERVTDDHIISDNCSGVSGVTFEKSTNNWQIYHNVNAENRTGVDIVLAADCTNTGINFFPTNRNGGGGCFRFDGPG